MTEKIKRLTALLVSLTAAIVAIGSLAATVKDLRQERGNDFQTVVVLAQQLAIAQAKAEECK